MNRTIVATVAAVAASAGTAVAAAPAPTTLDVVLQPGQRIAMTMGQVPRGEFRFSLKASSDGVKKFVLSQQRVGAARFKVIDGASEGCTGAAGTLVCSAITTPAPTTTGRYIFRLTNLSGRPMSMTLMIGWSKITSAE